MKPTFQKTTANSLHRAAADHSSQNGIAMPAVPSHQGIPEETTADMEEPLLLDMDEDGVDEQHTLLLEDDILYLHSDKQALSLFIARKRKKKLSKQEAILLNDIEKLALIVHTGKYGTKDTSSGKSKRKAPLKQDRKQGKKALQQIALLLAKLSQLSQSPTNVMKKMRPPSHQKLLVPKTILGDTFCQKVVMEPLSTLLRDDGIRGSSPSEETNLWKRLTKLAGYKRGHMLNEHLHGPGTNNNLVPISTAFNSTMKTGVEHATKEAVNANNKVVRFEAEALNWGNFKGALGAPDEQLLPSHFRFKVTQMTLIPNQGYDGSDISHWQEDTSKNVIFDQTQKHDIPVDIAKGAVAHVTKEFAPGIYYHPGGTIQQVSPAKYHLRGHFSVNNQSLLFPALAMDDKSKLNYDIISANVTTKYKVPPGYHIVLPFGPEELEFILYNDEIKKVTSSIPAFLIVNSSRHTSLQHDFNEDKRLATERVAARKKLLLDQKAMEEQQRKEREAQRRIEQEEKEQKKLEMEKNEHFRHDLYRIVRTEARKYESKFNDVFLERFIEYCEYILGKAGKEWKKDDQLYTKHIEGLLDPCRQELEKIKNKLLEDQVIYEEEEEIKRQKEEEVRQEEERIQLALEKEREFVINSMVEQINEKAANDHYPKLTSEDGQLYYIRKKNELLRTYTKFWIEEVDVLNKDYDQLLNSALEKLNKIFGLAMKITDRSAPDKRKLKISKDDQQKEKEDRQTKRRIPQDHFKLPPTQSSTTTLNIPPPFSFNPQPQRQNNPQQPVDHGNKYKNTAQQISGAAAEKYRSLEDGFLREQVLRLKQPLGNFIQYPTAEGWTFINNILLELQRINELSWLANGWLALWYQIRPS